MTNAKAKSGLGKERIPTPLFTDQYLCGEFTLALLNDQLARGKVGGDPLTCVSRCKFGAIGIERSLRERATQQVAEPANDGRYHLRCPPCRLPAGNFSNESGNDHVIRNKLWLQRRLNCAAHIRVGRERHQRSHDEPGENLYAPKGS
jgi:hypothetical protein